MCLVFHNEEINTTHFYEERVSSVSFYEYLYNSVFESHDMRRDNRILLSIKKKKSKYDVTYIEMIIHH